MKQSILIMFGILLMSANTFGQKRDYGVIEAELETKTGIDRLQVLYDLCNQDINNNQELCRQRGWEMVDSATVYDNRKYIGWGYRFVGLSYHYTSVLDSARFYYELCAPFFDAPKDQGWSFYNIASIFEIQSQYDSVEYYLNIAEPLFLQDTSALVQLGSVASMRGSVAGMKGDHAFATEYYLKSKDLMAKAGDMPRYGDAIRKVGESYGFQDEYEKALIAQEEAAKIYRESNDAYYECLAYSDMGNSLHALGNIDSAEYYFNKSIEISRRVKHDFVTGMSLHRLATINADKGNISKARLQFAESNDIYHKTGDIYAIVFNLERQARMENNISNFSGVIGLTQKGIEMAQNADLFQLKSELLMWQSKAQEATGKYQSALMSFQSHQAIQDSLNSKDRSDKLQELLIQYETEKKEKELIISQAENDRKTANNKLLIIGLIGLGISALLFISSMRLKQRKNRMILRQENELEVEKRKFVERELEFKKKELTAKALQLARKNEFLVTLEGEVSGLKNTVDDKVKMSSERIRRMIQHDANDDEDWNHFAKEFSSIHEDFITKLSAKHGVFSTNDLRLVSLMKMNLSTKDIASTLRVSPDGIKKARYRLRKKMGVDSSVDLQEYLLNYG